MSAEDGSNPATQLKEDESETEEEGGKKILYFTD